MSEMFYNCDRTMSLPDNISKISTNSLNYLNDIFHGCLPLALLPDISEWFMDKVIDISKGFMNCSSLIALPDISKWRLHFC